MALFEHPLQLFSLQYPEGWELRYQEDSGSLILVNPSTQDPTALSLSPLAITGEGFSIPGEVVQAAERMSVAIDPKDVRVNSWGDSEVGYGEGVRTDGAQVGGRYRFWVIRHAALAIYAAQLGPGVELDFERERADTILQSLAYPELMPPTAEEFRARVLDVLEKEYAHLRAAPKAGWAIDLTDTAGQAVGMIGLENLYRACLMNAESTGAMIREYLDQVLSSLSTDLDYGDYGAVRERLLPMLKSNQWVEEIPGGDELVTVTFAEGLVMCFAIDEPSRVAFVRKEMLDKWNVPVERVQEVAQDNLAARSRELQVMSLNGEDGKACALIINTQDGYDATRLVLPNIRDGFAAELGDEYLVGLPNRDFLVAFSDRSPELAAGIVRQIRQDYHQMDHPLTSTIYRVRSDRVEPSDM